MSLHQLVEKTSDATEQENNSTIKFVPLHS